MVKSRFPGKPAKYFHRKKVSSSVHNQDYEGSKAAEDIYNRLNIFKSVFGTEDEVSSFHGFSPHEVELAAKKANSNYKALKKELKDRGLSVEVLKEPESLTIYKSVNKELRSFKECSKTNNLLKTVQQQKESDIICLDGVTKSVSADCNKSEVDSRTSVLDKNEESNCNKITSNVSTLSGKFVLPTRSAHSSRVIKPNKRFIQSDSNSVPIKKTRPTHKKDFATGESDRVCEKSNKEISYERKVNMESLFGENSAGHRKHKRLGLLTQSPVKVILRKPRLNIKSESYTSVEGPFSSSSSSTLGNQGSQKQAQVPAKVVCGVCGSIRLYKFLKQARKFGIFSCEPCRRFILKILKMERQKTLQPLNCISGNGTCRIRHSALESSQMFSTELSQKKFHGDGPRRCQGCWLNLCLKSFNVPHEVYTRLVSYLPKIYPKKSTPGFSNTGGQWADTSLGLGTLGVSPALTYIGPSRSLSYELAKSIKRKATAIARRDPTTLPNNFNATNQGISKDMKESSRIKLRQKLQVPGPRVKHVCRSASLVLGQPAATFIPAVKNSTFEMKKPKSDGGIPIKQQSRSIEREDVSTSPKTSKGDVEILSVQEEHVKPKDVSGPPIARMLQDLGRVNWELLDGIEKQETELLHAKVSIDFWESYDPEEVSQTGFSLLGFGKFRLRALCFLCGSAGQDKLLHCASCCEPYHTYCVSNLKLTNNTKEWWKVDWLCPRCTYCVSCRKAGGVQLTCAKCSQSYHTACISTARCNVTENNWLCSSCLCCKSCNDTSVHVFVGNLPLCKACFKLRKRGSFCPLCQRCYDDNDYSTKMMECAQCKSWIHAKCEGLSNEKYQVLSYLPSSIEFICRLCCKSPPALWSLAIDSELKAGYLNVLKVLSKNRSACALLKSSPKKQTVCTCQDSHRRPIHLPDLSDQQESSICKEKDLISSPAIDDKNSDFGLLTPKMTKDDEESLKTVKSGFLSLVNEKNSQSSEKEDGKCNLRECAVKNLPEESLSSKSTESGCDRQLLSIAYHRIDAKGSQLSPHAMSQSDSGIGSTDDEQKCSVDDSTEARQNSNEKNCPCYCKHISAKPSLNLLSIKNKANSDEYTSLLQFHQDMEQVIEGVRAVDLLKIYHKALKQVFPWFDPKESQICVSHPDIDLHVVMNIQNKLDDVQPKRNSSSTNSINNSFKGLLDMDQDYYYSGLKINDTRICMLCKSLGEGLPTKEERLLYCGNNEWVHGNCALWSSEVFEEIDGSLQNVQSAISRARLIRCNGCSKKGASIGCCARSCSVAYHFSCALLADCIFLENKEVYCQNHRHLTESKEHHKEKDFPISRSIYVELDHRKRKDVPKHQVKLIIGSLYVEDFGTVVPEFSDRDDLIIPCDFKCTRLYWSCIEPWKIVQYHIKTSIQQSSSEYLSENDINYTVDHSLDFTPPPSPVDTVVFENLNRTVEEKDVKSVIGHILDVICSKEEESNLSVDQQATDLLPPELKDAIFEDLPHDILDGISVNDIFHKMMNFDDVISAEIKNDKSEASPETENLNLDSNHKRQKSDEEGSGTKQTTISFTKNNLNSFKSQGSCNSHLNSYCRLRSSGRHKEVDKKAEGENLIERGKENKWKRKSILQVDGTVDCSESEHSNDSCDFGSTLRSNLVAEKTVCTSNVSYLGGVIKSDNPTDDKPVKCTRCHRTYRTSVGFDRHLSTCNSDDYFSCSESDSSEEEKSTGADDMIITDTMAVEVVVQNVQPELVFTSDQCEMVTEANVMNSHISFQQSAYNGTNGITENLISEVSHVEFGKVPAAVNVTLIESKTKSIDDSNLSLQSKRQRVPKCYNVKKKTTNSVISNHMPQHILNSSPTSHQQSVVEIQSANSGNSAIILQPINSESVIPAYIESYQQHNHPSIQYVTTIDTQEKAQYLAPDPLVPGTYHIQSAPIAQPVVQNLPTVLGTIIQPNGMEQIVVNNPNPGIEVYNPQQSSVFITNSPVYVGMETVVSNTVMSSSQFISSSIPGMLAASSYSATTTQVFQATKPILDIPQSYVVVNTHQPLLENPPPPPAPPPPPPPPCIPQIFSNQSLPQQPIPWANYQVNFQEAYKMDKSSSYQTVTRQIIHEAKDLDGVKMINSTQETIVIEPLSTAPKITEIRHDVDKIDGPVKELSKLVSQISSSASGNFDRPQSSQIKGNFVKLVELPSSSAIDREKPQQAVAPVVVKKIVANGPEYVKRDKSELPTSSIKTLENSIKGVVNKKENFENFANANTIGNRIVQYSNIRNEIKEILIPKSRGLVEPRRILKPVIRHKNSSAPFNFNKEQLQKKTIVKEEPKITYEITSDDGFSYTTTNVLEAWKKVFETVQIAREGKGLPPLTQNPFSSPDSMLKKMMGLGNNGMKYILEQLPGIGRCVKYKSVYHKKELSALEHELSRSTVENPSGCARTEPFNSRHKYDMFSWLASRHRRPPKLLNSDSDLNVNSRRATSSNLPMAMRFRHLKETSKQAVGVFRSDIHGRGLFCLRDIESGEMVIEYAGEVIRSVLTDLRERYYTSKGIGCYMFRIDDKFVVDATMKGNAARFINHSCEPNCYSRVVDILGKKHILIFALRRIPQGEELTYDYKFPLEEEKINCHCLSRKCRKYLN